MLRSSLYSVENLGRARYAQIGVIVVAAIACVYFGSAIVGQLNALACSKSALQHFQEESARLSKEASSVATTRLAHSSSGRGGIGPFAVSLASSARAHGIALDSLTPQTTEELKETEIDGISLGRWASSEVRVVGHGKFEGLLDFLDSFRSPRMPMELKSFALQSSGDKSGSVGFEIILTVYEGESI